MSIFKGKLYGERGYSSGLIDIRDPQKGNEINFYKYNAMCRVADNWYRLLPTAKAKKHTTLKAIKYEVVLDEYEMVSGSGSLNKTTFLDMPPIPPVITHSEYTMGDEEYQFIPMQLSEVKQWSV